MTRHRGGESCKVPNQPADNIDLPESGSRGGRYRSARVSRSFSSTVLYLPDAFLGQTDQRTDLGECQSASLGTGVYPEAVMYDFLLDVAEIGRVVDHHMDGLGSSFEFILATTIGWFIGGFERRIELSRESLTILRVLHAQTGEGLQYRPTGVGGELESPFNVELVDASQEQPCCLR